MAAYHYTDEANKNTYNRMASDILHQFDAKIEEAVHSRDNKTYYDLCDKMGSQIHELAAQFPFVVGKNRNEACVQVCKICDEHNETEAFIFRQEGHEHRRAMQEAYIFKENGTWYVRQTKTGKSRRRVVF